MSLLLGVAALKRRKKRVAYLYAVQTTAEPCVPACEILPKGCRFSPLPLLLIKPGRRLIHLAGRCVGSADQHPVAYDIGDLQMRDLAGA